MTATFRLMQESGVQGPVSSSRTVRSYDEIGNEARKWAIGQPGHPWDTLVADLDDGDEDIVTIDIEQF